MDILGLHGVYNRSHDASACLVSDNEVRAYAEEERFVRSKKAFDHHPENAVRFCLESTQTDINDIAAITYGWQGPELTARDVLPATYYNQLTEEVPIVQIQHHEAHAASVFYTSSFSEAAVLVVDGQGEDESTTLWRASKQDGMEKLASYGVDQSLGYFYAAVSKYCGLGSFGAGKLMGLAPYGIPRYVELLDCIYNGIELPEQSGHDSQDAFFDQFLDKLRAQGFPPVELVDQRDSQSLKVRSMPVLTELQRDMASSAQYLLEQKILKLAEQARQLTGLDYLCMAGGVAMNCVTNSIVQDSGLFKDLFVQPGCEDCGVAMGSALAYSRQEAVLPTPYTGPKFSDEAIATVLTSLGIRSVRHDSIAHKAAELLATGTVMGWFQGGMEYGPRALGGRSILANPATTSIRDEVNRIKRREPWRPFGPSVLAEHTADLFENPHDSPYMLRSFMVRPEWQERLAAVVHVDGSTRPQTVARPDNPRYYDLIQAFYGLTGLPAVLNTSFNDYDEPIVATPIDAIKTFYSTNLGALVLGDRLILK